MKTSLATFSRNQFTENLLLSLFSDGERIGAVETYPYDSIWNVNSVPADVRTRVIHAEAEFSNGETVKSPPVVLLVTTGAPPFPVMNLLYPTRGEILLQGSSFARVAELLASLGEAGPVDFVLDGKVVATVGDWTRPFTLENSIYSLEVKADMAEGTHNIRARYPSIYGVCECRGIEFSIARLAISKVTLDEGLLVLHFITVFQKPHVVERSDDLSRWSQVSTNMPSNEKFNFSERVISEPGVKWYRAVIQD